MEGVIHPKGSIRVRFAPSPTGFLHVGGARTAIFNWLFAKNNNGKFLLRIEDTDSERSKSELSEQIIRSLNWLEMPSDEPIVYQSDRINRYKDIIIELLNKKKAYYCFETAEELEKKRKEAQSKKVQYKYDRASLKLDDQTIRKYLTEHRNYTIRFLIPEGNTTFNDIVHGETKFNNSELDDFVILRSDGSPVYQIAVVVDDHDMNITHVIRGDDHLSNTPKQILLYQALGWEPPTFAHLPMILDEQKKKLSKRRDPVSAEEYNLKGYLPEALFNFLTLLGYAPPENKEIITREELIKVFSFERVNKKSAVFDMKKLNWINSEYIKKADINRLSEMVISKLKVLSQEKSMELTDTVYSKQYVNSVINIMKERVSTVNDFIEFGSYFFLEPDKYDEKALTKYWSAEKKELLKDYLEFLNKSGEFNDPGALEVDLRKFVELRGVQAAVLIHPLRLAITGISISPGIFDVMLILRKPKVIERISKFIDKN